MMRSMGHTSGGIVNVSLRSGNKWRSMNCLRIRPANKALGANSFQNNAASAAKGEPRFEIR
jgi:hypothetical protein